MDQIQIQNLEVYCHHGLLKEENVLGQKFLVSLTLETNTRKAGLSDEMEHSIDYAKVSHFVEEKMKQKNYKLIEAVSEHLAEDLLLEFPLIECLKLEVKKPWAPILLPLDTVSVSIQRGWHQVYLSIGANLGDKEKQIQKAVELLRQDSKIKAVKTSTLIETEPYGYVDQPTFLNGAVSLKTLYTPEELLEVIHQIEEAGERKREIHWGPRTIDLDIITYDDEIVEGENLVIPHPDYHNRTFVLKPLSELAPWLKHPVMGYTTMQLLQQLEEDKKND